MTRTNGMWCVVELYGPTGKLLATDGGSAPQLSVTLTNSGLHTILCKELSGTATGTYSVTMSGATGNVLGTPTVNTASGVSAGGFTANWSAASGATGYRLDVATTNTFSPCLGGWQDVDVGNATSRNVTNLTAGTTHYYRVRAYNASSTSGNSGVMSVTTLAPNLSAYRQGAQIVLTWATNAPGFSLQFTTNVTGLSGWTAASPSPVVMSGKNVVSNNLSQPKLFYRLRKP